MAQAPEDVPAEQRPSDTPSQPSVASTGADNGQSNESMLGKIKKSAQAGMAVAAEKTMLAAEKGKEQMDAAVSATKQSMEVAKEKTKTAAQKVQAGVALGLARTQAKGKELSSEVEHDFENIQSMEGLLLMAINEFKHHLRQKAKTTDKVDFLKKIADSLRSAHGICFAAVGNVQLGPLGGGYGRGFVMKRLSERNWSLPFAIKEVGIITGFGVDISITKQFYVLKNDQAVLNYFDKKNAKLGASAFAALGDLGIEAQGNVKASADSLTKTTNDAKTVAATNAGVSSKTGVSAGIAIDISSFQSCNTINNDTYENFNKLKLMEQGVNDPENESNIGGDHGDDEKDENFNKIKVDGVIEAARALIDLLESEIAMQQALKEVEAKAKQMREEEQAAANQGDTSVSG